MSESRLQKTMRCFELMADFGKTFGLRRMINKGICIATQNNRRPLRNETIITTMNGYRMFLLPYDRGISKELKTFRIHEPLATKILKSELRKGMTIVDIGSNIGYYVILESKLVGNQGKIVAIEPIKRNFQCLLKNIKLNRLSNVTPINAALSNQKGSIKMVNSVYSNKSHVLSDKSKNVMNIEEVTTLIGDDLLKFTDNIGLLRLDVEGYEDYVIKGCNETIQKWSPDIMVEIHSPLLGKKRFQNLMHKFRDYGYKTKYALPRIVDFPLVANDSDVTTPNNNEILNKSFSNSKIWSYFTLFLKHSSQN